MSRRSKPAREKDRAPVGSGPTKLLECARYTRAHRQQTHTETFHSHSVHGSSLTGSWFNPGVAPPHTAASCSLGRQDNGWQTLCPHRHLDGLALRILCTEAA